MNDRIAFILALAANYLLVLPAILAANPQTARAEDFFSLERPRLGLGLSYEMQDERRRAPNVDIYGTTHEFGERIDIETSGWLYDPRFMSFRVDLHPEFRQIDQEGNDEGGVNKDDFFPAYGMDVTFLQAKPYTLHLYGQRRESTLKSAFARRSVSQTDAYGADLRLNFKALPSTLSYSNTKTDQQGFYDSTDENESVRFSASHLLDRSQTYVNASYSDAKRITTADSYQTESTYGSLQNLLYLAEDRRATLSSFWSLRNTEYFLSDTSGWRVAENLSWRHTARLKSFYKFAFDKNESDTFDNDVKTLGAGLTYRLTPNFTSTVSGDAQMLDFTGGTEERYRTSLDLGYNRNLSWGRLNLFAEYDYQIAQRETSAAFVQVIDESHILNDAFFTTLDNKNVDIGTVIVTDIAGAPFVLDIDYRLQEVGNEVRISRTTTGGITNGQEVLVDYRYNSSPAYDDTLFGQTYGFRLFMFKALALSYRFNYTKQDVTDGFKLDAPIDDTIHAADVRWTWKITDTRLSFEDTDKSSGISYTRWLGEETLQFRPGKQFFFSVTGYLGKTRFYELDDTEDVYGIRCRLDWMPHRVCKFWLKGFQERIDGESEKVQNMGLSAALELAYGIWSGSIGFYYIDEDDRLHNDNRTCNSVRVEIARIPW